MLDTTTEAGSRGPTPLRYGDARPLAGLVEKT
jgi:hypothetical protein